MQQSTAAFLILAGLAVWTAVQQVRERRELWWHVVELGLATGAVIATRWVDTPDVAFRGTTTLPGVWPAVPVASIGIIKGWGRAG
jgi:hypothetical protein